MAYFLELTDDGEQCPAIISQFFLSIEAKCTMYFLETILFDIQKRSLELQRHNVSIINLSQIINGLINQLQNRLNNEYYGQNTRSLLNSLHSDAKKKLLDSFAVYVKSVIAYINKYYEDHRELCETVAVLSESDKL